MRTRVKICGITRIEDAQLAIDAGADAIGLVFYDKSPRFISSEKAQEISNMIPAFVSRVALFKDANQQSVQAVIEQAEIDLIQFHGGEDAAFCEQFNLPYIKALGMKAAHCDEEYLIENAKVFSTAKAILLDGHAPGEAGGTGETFDWSSVAEIDQAIVLAGGLTAENVKQAIEIIHPFAVDVSSGVESAPGIKDKDKVIEFMSQVATEKLSR